MPSAQSAPPSPCVLRTLRLRHGVTLHVRPILPEDDWRLAEMVNAASEAARRQRFPNGPMGPVSGARFQALCHVDQRQHVAWVVTCGAGGVGARDGGERVVAEARYRISATGLEAEFALMVHEHWQRRGIGSGLLRALAAHAGQSGVRMLIAELSADQVPALALLRRCRFKQASHPRQPRVLLLSATPDQVTHTWISRIQRVFEEVLAQAGACVRGLRQGFLLRHSR